MGFLETLKAEFSSDFFTQDSSELAAYGSDWTRVYPPKPLLIAFPKSTNEVSRFLKLCQKFSVSVVPSGGRTGLSGGAVASKGEAVLSLSKMNRIDPPDLLAQTVRVQAGAITEAVHQICEAHGLTWPVDFASKGSSQVGGNISTNAGGVKVIRYGLTRNWVLGLQVVTMNGDVLELNGALEKNNTGIDLRQLFIGSEGILGVVTEATLKLTRLPETLDVFFFALESIEEVFQLFLEARKGPFLISAFEMLAHNCLEAVTENRGLKSPFAKKSPYYVLLEVERGHSGEGSLRLGSAAGDPMDAWLSDLFQNGKVQDGTLAQSPREAKDLWALREGISESLAVKGFVYKNDIALPISGLGGFLHEMVTLFKKRDASLELYVFGHIGDGNLHVNTMKPEKMPKDEFLSKCRSLDPDLFQLVQHFKGSISAEHGIGLLKKSYLSYSRSSAEIDLMKAMKKVLDPNNLLNPGKIFD